MDIRRRPGVGILAALLFALLWLLGGVAALKAVERHDVFVRVLQEPWGRAAYPALVLSAFACLRGSYTGWWLRFRSGVVYGGLLSGSIGFWAGYGLALVAISIVQAAPRERDLTFMAALLTERCSRGLPAGSAV